MLNPTIAVKDMVQWLENDEEFHSKPYKIECMHEFDLYNYHYYVFRFKKKLFSDWLLGVCGGYDEHMVHTGQIYSEFKVYKDATAIDESIQMVEMIRAYWQRQAKRQKFEEAFQSNLSYISQTTIDVQKIERQFVKDANHFYLTVGTADFPSGKIVVADPLAFLPARRFSPQLELSIPIGSYPIEVSIYRNPDLGIRMCTTRLKVKDTPAIHYQCATPTQDTAVASNENQPLSGFPVDAGMMTICDAQVAHEYCQFLDEWHQENPDKNHYDDYFAAYFAQSYQQFPAYQREGGDFIVWENPKFHHQMIMVASGLGDGFYQAYIGKDENQEICDVIVPMVDPECFAYEENH